MKNEYHVLGWTLAEARFSLFYLQFVQCGQSTISSMCGTSPHFCSCSCLWSFFDPSSLGMLLPPMPTQYTVRPLCNPCNTPFLFSHPSWNDIKKMFYERRNLFYCLFKTFALLYYLLFRLMRRNVMIVIWRYNDTMMHRDNSLAPQ